MNRTVNPRTVAPPAARYAHAVLSESPGRILHTAGVVPTDADGAVPEGLAEQAAVVWDTIGQILTEAGMAVRDIVSVTTYVVVGNDLSTVMASRDRALGGHLTASTLVLVPALAQPAWRLEVAVVAVAG